VACPKYQAAQWLPVRPDPSGPMKQKDVAEHLRTERRLQCVGSDAGFDTQI
jgi:hypothetical protein